MIFSLLLIHFQGFSSRLLAPSFGHTDSKLLVEAFRRTSTHQHSIHIKPFSEAPKEVPIHNFPVALTSEFSVHEFQSELAHDEMKRSSPCFDAEAHPNDFISSYSAISPSSSNGTNQFETPSASLRRQAYVALKASPNVSANGDALHHCFCSCNSHYYAGIGMCL